MRVVEGFCTLVMALWVLAWIAVFAACALDGARRALRDHRRRKTSERAKYDVSGWAWESGLVELTPEQERIVRRFWANAPLED